MAGARLSMVLALALLLPSQDEAQIRGLIEKLRADSPTERDTAARELKKFGRAALPALDEAVKDRDSEVAARASQLRRAIDALITLPDSVLKAFPGIEDRLSASDYAWTGTFLELAAKHEVPRSALHPLAERALREARTREDVNRVLMAIDRYCLHRAMPEILRLVREDRLSGRNDALLVLADLNRPEVLPELLKLVDRSDPLRLERVAHCLAGLRSKRAIPLLVPLLKDEDRDIREIAFTTLSSLEAPEVKPQVLERLGKASKLLELLTSGSQAVKLDLKEAIPILRERLPKLGRSSQLTALSYLLALGSREELEKVKSFLDETDERYRQSAAGLLAHYGGRAYAGEIARHLRHPDPGTRTYAVTLLIRLETRDRIEEIAPLAQDGLQAGGDPRKTVEVRTFAVEALEKLGGRDRLSQIEKALEDPEGLVRGRAALALARLGVKEQIPRIAELLAHPHWSEQKQAIEALAILGARDRAPAIERLLNDRDVEVRKAAATALHGLEALPAGDRVAAMLLAGIEPHQVQGVAETLCSIGLPEGVPIVLQICCDARLSLQEPPNGQMRWTSRKSLEVLNGVREPAAWKRLGTMSAPSGIEGTRRELIEKIAGSAGLQVVWSADGAWEDDRWILGRHRLPEQPETLLETLRVLMSVHGHHQSFPEAYQFIVEGDRMRLLHTADALDAWESWWESRKKQADR